MADIAFTVKERTTRKFTAVIQDENGTAIPVANLTTVTLTLYEKRAGTIINSRNAQDVKNLNGVTIDSGGNLTWIMDPLDNAIIAATGTPTQEDHVALFVWTYPSGKRGQYEVLFIVENASKVP
jgi:hypothetical protein